MPLVDNQLRRFSVAAALVALATAVILGGLWFANEPPGSATVHSASVERPTAAAPMTPLSTTSRDVGKPERLTIKSIGVDAPITEVGTTAEGAQDVPRSIDATGWWRDGVQPGRHGNAVIVGHTAGSADGVFDNLGKLGRGDSISVRSTQGILRYLVTKGQSTKVADFGRISPLVYRPSGPAGLVLMTCGDWNGERYESTTIVFATLAAN